MSKTSGVDLIKFWAVLWNIPGTMFTLFLLLPLPGVELVGVKPEKRRTFFRIISRAVYHALLQLTKLLEKASIVQTFYHS